MKHQHTPQGELLQPPGTDDALLTDLLGAKGYTDDVPLAQYAAWAEQFGLTALLGAGESTASEIIASTALTEAGADALLGVLVSIGIVVRRADQYSLSELARDYLLPESPFYMGQSVYVTCHRPIPAAMVKEGTPGTDRRSGVATLVARRLKRLRGWAFGGPNILANQHSRNLPAAVTAAHSSLFRGTKCLVDMAGGTGTFAVPFAQQHPDARVILADLPESIPGIRKFLRAYGMNERITLTGMDVFADKWPIPECDAVFFGNFIHGFEDARCVTVLRRCLDVLRPGGKVVLHELTWNDDRSGPLKTALFNVTMRVFGGKQRTLSELRSLLVDAGYTDLFVEPTKGGFVMIGGVAPAANTREDLVRR